jgi:hypothetical protein
MKSSFGKFAKGWVGVASGKLFCVINGVKFLCVIYVGSYHLSCQHSKSLLSHTKQLVQWPNLMLKGLPR